MVTRLIRPGFRSQMSNYPCCVFFQGGFFYPIQVVATFLILSHFEGFYCSGNIVGGGLSFRTFIYSAFPVHCIFYK